MPNCEKMMDPSRSTSLDRIDRLRGKISNHRGSTANDRPCYKTLHNSNNESKYMNIIHNVIEINGREGSIDSNSKGCQAWKRIVSMQKPPKQADDCALNIKQKELPSCLFKQWQLQRLDCSFTRPFPFKAIKTQATTHLPLPRK